jgi:two-component system, CitB family, sensor kinase
MLCSSATQPVGDHPAASEGNGTAMRRSGTLASRILVAVLGILVVTLALGVFLVLRFENQSLDRDYEARAVGIAETAAQDPEVAGLLATGDPGAQLQVLASRVVHASGATYVVITDRSGTRFSHPNAALIGRKLEEPLAVLDGRSHTGIDEGSLGRSANGKAPIRDDSGAIVGQVSVGILETHVAGQFWHEALIIALYSLLVLGIGVVASWFLARTIKRLTFGLELHDFAALLQEREAMLHGIREGVLCFDEKGRLTVVNAEAEQLLGLKPDAVGRTAADLVPPGRLRDVLTGSVEGGDLEILTDDYLLVVNRRKVGLGGRSIGSVVTLRDRTEQESLLRELRALGGLTSTLRAQEHEYANRLHAMSVLMDMGELVEARDYLTELSEGAIGRAEDLRSRISPPALAALLTAKFALAAERSVELVVTPDSHLDQPRSRGGDLISIVGNLVDNALEALAGQPEPRLVTVDLNDDDGVHIVVRDTGPGIDADDPTVVFQDGWSTKAGSDGPRRGLGLALVHRIVRRTGGTIAVSMGDGTCFEVRLPDADVPARAAALTATTGPA